MAEVKIKVSASDGIDTRHVHGAAGGVANKIVHQLGDRDKVTGKIEIEYDEGVPSNSTTHTNMTHEEFGGMEASVCGSTGSSQNRNKI